MSLNHVLAQVADERMRQEQLKAEGRFAKSCADPMPDGERLAHDVHDMDLRKELVQVAAVAVAWIEGLDAETAARWADEVPQSRRP